MSRRPACLFLVLAACAASSPAARPLPEPAPEPVAAPPPEPSPASEAPSGESLGHCLSRHGLRLYGASWCGACRVQLALFGETAADVPYVDCFPNPATSVAVPDCQAVGLGFTSPFPTWIFPDGRRLVGAHDPGWLASTAGCPL